LAQCRFPGLAISNAKTLIFFSNKIYRNDFIKQPSETVMVGNYQDADCSLRKKNVIGSFSEKLRYLCNGMTYLHRIWRDDAELACLHRPFKILTVKNEDGERQII